METTNAVPAPEPKPFSFVTLDALRRKKDRPFKDVEVPELQMKLRLAVMTGKDRQEFVAMLAKIRKETPDAEEQGTRIPDVHRFLLAKCIVEPETFQPVFTGEDVAILDTLSFHVLDTLAAEARKLNAIGSQAEDEAAGN